jgi:phosphatidylethanolamine-binding protein (PEBP) family uncharacterized protein
MAGCSRPEQRDRWGSVSTMRHGQLLQSVMCALVLASVLGGCGSAGSPSSPGTKASDSSSTASQSGSPGPSTVAASAEEGPGARVDLDLRSPIPRNPIPSRYTCDGANLSLPLRWRKPPPGTAELALFMLDAEPVNGKLFAQWAVAGISPSVHSLAAGRLPKGAIVGRNGSGAVGYTLCPSKGVESVRYLLTLYALPRKIAVAPGFDANEVNEKVANIATNSGLLGFSYTRR